MIKKTSINRLMRQKPLVVLKSAKLRVALKKHWLTNHENLEDPKGFTDDFFEYLAEKSKGKYSAREIKGVYKKKLKIFRKKESGLKKPKDMFLEMLEKEIGEARIIMDFGCGKAAFAKELAFENKTIEKIIGIDPRSNPNVHELDARIEFYRDISRIKNETVDLVVVKLVLHHLKNDKEIEKILSKIRKVLRPGGKLIIFEESFSDGDYQVSKGEDYLAQFNLEVAEATENFLNLSREEKIQFLFLNDWLMNMQNDYMPWTGQYKSMEEWRKIGEATGFKEEKGYFLGAIKKRKRKQGMTAYMLWKKIDPWQ